MPVLPEVGSITTLSGFNVPSFSAASIMDAPIRSFTLAEGLKNSDFKNNLASKDAPHLTSSTRGVLPIDSTIFMAMIDGVIFYALLGDRNYEWVHSD